jgi:thioester reductase-like protein
MHPNKRVFVTGGTGLLGRAVLSEPRASQIVALCHRTMLVPGAVPPGVELTCIQGDLCSEQLGLDDETYARLAGDVDVILHLAAVTRFTVKSEKIHQTNTLGTKRIVELARRTGARLVYVSTAYVEDGSSALAAPSVYEQSKREAEALVRELPNATIVRPSIIIGDSRTGRVAAYQGFHHIVGCMVDGTLPALASTPGRLGDFVAQDWVSDAVWAAALHQKSLGTLWVTSGPKAMAVEQIRDVAVLVGRQLGFDPPTPRIVPYETFERLIIPVFLKSLPSRLQRQFLADLKLSRYMNQIEPLPSSEELLCSELGLAPREPQQVVLERNMHQWALDLHEGNVRSRNGMAPPWRPAADASWAAK